VIGSMGRISRVALSVRGDLRASLSTRLHRLLLRAKWLLRDMGWQKGRYCHCLRV